MEYVFASNEWPMIKISDRAVERRIEQSIRNFQILNREERRQSHLQMCVSQPVEDDECLQN